MSNLKILMNGIITENPTFVLLIRYVSYLGNDLFGHQRHEYGIGYECSY